MNATIKHFDTFCKLTGRHSEKYANVPLLLEFANWFVSMQPTADLQHACEVALVEVTCYGDAQKIIINALNKAKQ